MQAALNGETSYRIRHKKPVVQEPRPLIIGGYGVELALKRTDYIVIDDRDAEGSSNEQVSTKAEVILEDEELADLKPLSTSELVSLGLKASSFIMQSENPFQMLTRLSQDFPRYSSAIAAHNTSSDFASEHTYNRGQLAPAGMNVFWINGLQVSERQVDAFSILDILRKERKLMHSFHQLGLTGPEAIGLLSHPDIAAVKADNEPQRFDWRDDAEGGNVIIWLNDIEKDERYQDWPADVKMVCGEDYQMFEWILIDFKDFAKNISWAAAADTKRYLQSGPSCRFVKSSGCGTYCRTYFRICKKKVTITVRPRAIDGY